MEQCVLLVQEVIDAKAKRGLFIDLVLNACVSDEEAVKGAGNVADNIRIVERGVHFPTVAPRKGQRPILVRTVGRRQGAAPVRHIRYICVVICITAPMELPG